MCIRDRSKKKRSKDRPLGNTSGKWSGVRAVFPDGDVLRTISEVGRDNGESSIRKSKSRGESCQENLMVSGVEGCG